VGRLIGLLALLNVVVLAAGLSLGQMRGKPVEPVAFNADKVRLLERVEPAAPPRSTAEPTATPAPPTTAAKLPAWRCLAWPAMDAAMLGEVESRLKKAGIRADQYNIQLAKHLAWWVYLPPFADAEAMQAAINAARDKGVKDIAPVRSGEQANAVSLGAFPTLAKARRQLEKSRALGFSDAQMGPRPNSGNASLVIAESVPEARLAELAAGWGRGRTPTPCGGH